MKQTAVPIMKKFLSRLSELLTTSSFLHYLIAGGIAFVVEYTSFLALLLWLDVALVPSNILSFIMGLATSFVLNKIWVFGKVKQIRTTSSQAILYSVLALANLCLTSTLITLLVSLGVIPEIAKVVLMLSVAVWNYIIFKRVIFSHKASRDKL